MKKNDPILKGDSSNQECVSFVAITLLLVFALPFSAFSQTVSTTKSVVPCDSLQRVIVHDTTIPSLVRYGVSVEFALPVVNARFTGLPNVPSCCPQSYLLNSALGLGVEALGELPIIPKGGIGARIGLSSFSMNFSYRENIPVSDGAKLFTIPRLFTLSTSIVPLSIEGYMFYRPIEMLTIQAGIGLATMLSGSYNQSERLDTVGFTYPGFRSERNVLSGAIPNLASVLPLVRFGVSYEFPLTKKGNFLIAPEASFSFGFGNVVNNLQGTNALWTLSSARLGASVRYSPERATKQTVDELAALQEKEDEIYRRKREECLPATKPVQKNVILAAITSLKGIQSNGSLSEVRITIEEFLASRSRYVLNTVFFGLSSSDIALRYERVNSDERGAFQIESFANADVLQIYYHVLNILGKRLTLNPKVSITLVGYADGLKEKNDKRLAIARAEKVKEYLLNVWGIEGNRVKVQSGVSRTPTGADGDDLLEAEEQRRVEIQSASRAVLEELRFEYILRVVEPQKIRIAFEFRPPSSLRYWFLEGFQTVNGKSIADTTSKLLFARKDSIIPEEGVYDWEISKSEHLIESREPVLIRLRAVDAENHAQDSPTKEIPVQILSVGDKDKQRAPDKRIDSYTLFSFAYGTNAPISGNADVQRVVAAIKQTLKTGAKVTVSGYTDIRGNEITNGILAQQRANAVASLIGFPNMIVNSFPATKINDNSFPEGRFYNRFVQVDVQTPLR